MVSYICVCRRQKNLPETAETRNFIKYGQELWLVKLIKNLSVYCKNITMENHRSKNQVNFYVT